MLFLQKHLHIVREFDIYFRAIDTVLSPILYGALATNGVLNLLSHGQRQLEGVAISNWQQDQNNLWCTWHHVLEMGNEDFCL